MIGYSKVTRYANVNVVKFIPDILVIVERCWWKREGLFAGRIEINQAFSTCNLMGRKQISEKRTGSAYSRKGD